MSKSLPIKLNSIKASLDRKVPNELTHLKADFTVYTQGGNPLDISDAVSTLTNLIDLYDYALLVDSPYSILEIIDGEVVEKEPPEIAKKFYSRITDSEPDPDNLNKFVWFLASLAADVAEE